MTSWVKSWNKHIFLKYRWKKTKQNSWTGLIGLYFYPVGDMNLYRSNKSATQNQYGPANTQASLPCPAPSWFLLYHPLNQQNSNCVIPHAGFKLQMYWICRSGVYTSHGDEDVGGGGGGFSVWMDRFAERAPIRVIRTESNKSGTSPIYLSLSFSCKLHSNPSEQSGIPSSELDTGSTEPGLGCRWGSDGVSVSNPPVIMCVNAQFRVQPEEFWFKSAIHCCIAWITGFFK